MLNLNLISVGGKETKRCNSTFYNELKSTYRVSFLSSLELRLVYTEFLSPPSKNSVVRTTFSILSNAENESRTILKLGNKVSRFEV